MAFDCYKARRSCTEWAKNDVKLRKYSKRLKLFPAFTPLEFVAIWIVGELIRTLQENRFLLLITNQFSELVGTVPLKWTAAATVVQAFVTHWVLFYGLPVD